MKTHSRYDLRDFHRFVGEKVNHDETPLTPEEALDQWRTLHPDPELGGDDRAAIQEAIDDMEGGDLGIAFEEFDREFRARRNLPPKP